MTDLLQQNMAIIRRRWPEVAQTMDAANPDSLDAMLVTGANHTISVNGIQLSSCYNRLAEAELMINQLPAWCSTVSVYGVGMGDVPTLLSDNKHLEHIRKIGRAHV